MMIPHDKALHIIAGTLAFALGNLIHMDAAIAAVILAAVTKEMADWWTGKGTADVWDIIATLAGGALGFICSLGPLS